MGPACRRPNLGVQGGWRADCVGVHPQGDSDTAALHPSLFLVLWGDSPWPLGYTGSGPMG